MENTLVLIIALVFLAVCPALLASEGGKPAVHVFYKDKAPSLRALEKIDAALDMHREQYDIRYLNIEDETNLELIESLGLPSTHFPVAVVIGGRFTIQRDGRIASFVHFPDFMKGIGRHEGNWSIADLEAALGDNSLFLESNLLPDLAEDESESQCE